ncbi:MAG: hypothetical protein LUD78_04180 [Clostridiales bacterium]|nr:hypothetical protein [Clostridiales bacterium]
MTAEKTKDWVDRVIGRSEDFEECLKTHWTDDSFGWGALLGKLWNEPADTRPTGLLLTGPEGCGRHAAAAHMVRILHGKEFGSVWLTGDDLLEEGNVSVAQERLDALLDDFWEKKKGLCLVLEQLEGRTGRKELLNSLGKSLWDYWLARETKSEASRLFLILIDSGRGIPSLLRERLQRCRMTLPGQQHRRYFLDNNAKDVAGYVDFDDCAEYTEGFTYAQMEDLVRDLRMQVDATEMALSPEELKQMVEEQEEEPPAARRRAVLEDRLTQMLDKLPELLNQLPALLQAMSNGGGSQANRADFSSSQIDLSSQNLENMSEEELRKSLEEKDPNLLVAEIFGEEEGKLLIQQAHEAKFDQPAAEGAEQEPTPIVEEQKE